VLWVSLPQCDICHKQMLIYDHITFIQLYVKECMNYKQCLNSLRTALVQLKLKVYLFKQEICSNKNNGTFMLMIFALLEHKQISS